MTRLNLAVLAYLLAITAAIAVTAVHLPTRPHHYVAHIRSNEHG